MRPLCVLLLGCLPWLPACGQKVDWAKVDTNIQKLYPELKQAKLSPGEQRRIVSKILSPGDREVCVDDLGRPGEFRFFRAPLGRPGILYVVPGPGCFRGGQGSNASLWLVERTGKGLAVLASPKQGFSGWGLGVQPAVSHGLHDIVVGWHMSAAETGLTYLRFDGSFYRKIGAVELRSCTNDSETLCLPDGRHAYTSRAAGSND